MKPKKYATMLTKLVYLQEQVLQIINKDTYKQIPTYKQRRKQQYDTYTNQRFIKVNDKNLALKQIKEYIQKHSDLE